MTNKRYHGWTNWHTWNVNLWIDNEYDLYQAKKRFLARKAPYLTAKDVESFCREIFPNGTPDMDPGDMQEVDWDDLAEGWNNEYREDE